MHIIDWCCSLLGPFRCWYDSKLDKYAHKICVNLVGCLWTTTCLSVMNNELADNTDTCAELYLHKYKTWLSIMTMYSCSNLFMAEKHKYLCLIFLFSSLYTSISKNLRWQKLGILWDSLLRVPQLMISYSFFWCYKWLPGWFSSRIYDQVPFIVTPLCVHCMWTFWNVCLELNFV